MLLNILKYCILLLLLCNIPGYLLVYFGPSLGSISSLLSSLLLLVYFILSKPWHKPALPFIVFGILFFALSGLNYTEVDTTNYFIKEFIRFMIVVVCITEVLYRTTKKDLFFILLIGGISVIINGLLFPEANVLHNLVKGRFSGFYLNPNYAASICLIGFALSYSIKNKVWSIIGQLTFTLAGILTLSRTFILVWLIINLIAIYKSRRNLIVPILGVVVLVLVLNFTDNNIFASNRFEALQSFFGDGPIKTKTIQEDSRNQTWAMYYDLIFEKPFIGHGFLKFQKHTSVMPGVHNTYLMIIGEAGVLPFLLFIFIYGRLFVKSVKYFNIEPTLSFITIIILLYLLVGHTYFFNFPIVLMSIYVYIQLRNLDELNTKTSNHSKIEN